MACWRTRAMSSLRNGIRRLNEAIAILLTLGVTASFASEPLTYYGFDEASHSAAAQEGLQEIFAGQLFHNAAPLNTARMMMRAMNGTQKTLGVDPNSPEGMFYTAGRF